MVGFRIQRFEDESSAMTCSDPLSSKPVRISVHLLGSSVNKTAKTDGQDRFETALKNAGKTYTLFAARLRNLLSYYLKSRLVEDYDTLTELLISNRLKESLPHGLLNYILTQEEKGWYVASKVASLADVYVNNRATVIGQKAPESKSAKVATAAMSE